jgi:hypothetical protein
MHYDETVTAVARKLYRFSKNDVAEVLEVLTEIWQEHLLQPDAVIHIKGLGRLRIVQQQIATNVAVKRLMQANHRTALQNGAMPCIIAKPLAMAATIPIRTSFCPALMKAGRMVGGCHSTSTTGKMKIISRCCMRRHNGDWGCFWIAMLARIRSSATTNYILKVTTRSPNFSSKLKSKSFHLHRMIIHI